MERCYGCRRPVFTPADATRWQGWLEYVRDHHDEVEWIHVSGNHYEAAEPEWSRAVCWSPHNCGPLAWADVHHETQAEHASVVVAFYRSYAARGSEIAIPSGMRVGTRHARPATGREMFETIEIAAMGASEVCAVARAVALLPGNTGNVAANTIELIFAPPEPWLLHLMVTNDASATGGRC